MIRDVYRYVFAPEIPIEEVEASLVLAILGVESLHGEARVRLDAAHYLERAQRACVIDAGTPVGRDLNRLFVGFISREFGPDTFSVERAETPSMPGYSSSARVERPTARNGQGLPSHKRNQINDGTG